MRQRETAERWSWLASQADALRRTLRGRFEMHEAEDVAQEAILRAGLSTAPIPPGTEGTAWLRRIARNIGIDRWRRERHLAPLEIAAHLAVGLDGAAGRIDVEVALAQLRPADRRLLQVIASGMRYAEIARAEGVEPTVIRQRVARARARLLAALTEEDHDRHP